MRKFGTQIISAVLAGCMMASVLPVSAFALETGADVENGVNAQAEAVTKIEEGSMHLKMSAELMDEVITEALHHVNKKKDEHTIKVVQTEDFILAKMDARLIVQVIINIVDNALKYTPKGSKIEIYARKENQMIHR